MQGEMIITEADMRTRFEGERDLITYAPYRVGDRIVRCNHCMSIVKTEFVTSNQCPLCGYPSFNPPNRPIPTTPTSPSALYAGGTTIVPSGRSLVVYLWLLICSGVLALLPYCFEDVRNLIYEATFNIGIGNAVLVTIFISVVAVLVLYFSSHIRERWQRAGSGCLLPLIPFSAFYLILAAIWLVIVVLAVIAALAAIALVIGIICALFSSD